MGDGDHLGPLGDDLVSSIGQNTTLRIQIEVLKDCSGPVAELLEGQEDRVVLGLADHDLVPGLQGEPTCRLASAAQAGVAKGGGQQVQSRCGTGSGHDLLAALLALCADQGGHA